MDIKVGMGQILVEGGRVKANLKRAVTMIKKAAAEGCDIIVLPECLDVGWTYPETIINFFCPLLHGQLKLITIIIKSPMEICG